MRSLLCDTLTIVILVSGFSLAVWLSDQIGLVLSIAISAMLMGLSLCSMRYFVMNQSFHELNLERHQKLQSSNAAGFHVYEINAVLMICGGAICGIVVAVVEATLFEKLLGGSVCAILSGMGCLVILFSRTRSRNVISEKPEDE